MTSVPQPLPSLREGGGEHGVRDAGPGAAPVRRPSARSQGGESADDPVYNPFRAPTSTAAQQQALADAVFTHKAYLALPIEEKALVAQNRYPRIRASDLRREDVDVMGTSDPTLLGRRRVDYGSMRAIRERRRQEALARSGRGEASGERIGGEGSAGFGASVGLGASALAASAASATSSQRGDGGDLSLAAMRRSAEERDLLPPSLRTSKREGMRNFVARQREICRIKMTIKLKQDEIDTLKRNTQKREAAILDREMRLNRLEAQIDSTARASDTTIVETSKQNELITYKQEQCARRQDELQTALSSLLREVANQCDVLDLSVRALEFMESAAACGADKERVDEIQAERRAALEEAATVSARFAAEIIRPPSPLSPGRAPLSSRGPRPRQGEEAGQAASGRAGSQPLPSQLEFLSRFPQPPMTLAQFQADPFALLRNPGILFLALDYCNFVHRPTGIPLRSSSSSSAAPQGVGRRLGIVTGLGEDSQASLAPLGSSTSQALASFSNLPDLVSTAAKNARRRQLQIEFDYGNFMEDVRESLPSDVQLPAPLIEEIQRRAGPSKRGGQGAERGPQGSSRKPLPNKRRGSRLQASASADEEPGDGDDAFNAATAGAQLQPRLSGSDVESDVSFEETIEQGGDGLGYHDLESSAGKPEPPAVRFADRKVLPRSTEASLVEGLPSSPGAAGEAAGDSPGDADQGGELVHTMAFEYLPVDQVPCNETLRRAVGLLRKTVLFPPKLPYTSLTQFLDILQRLEDSNLIRAAHLQEFSTILDQQKTLAETKRVENEAEILRLQSELETLKQRHRALKRDLEEMEQGSVEAEVDRIEGELDILHQAISSAGIRTHSITREDANMESGRILGHIEQQLAYILASLQEIPRERRQAIRRRLQRVRREAAAPGGDILEAEKAARGLLKGSKRPQATVGRQVPLRSFVGEKKKTAAQKELAEQLRKDFTSADEDRDFYTD